MKLKDMKGEEFVKKILEGEKDFSRIKLEEGFELDHYHDLSEQLHSYLCNYFKGYLGLWLDGKDDFKKEPFIFSESKFVGFKAGNYHNKLYLPLVKANKIAFYKSDLSWAVFSEGEFEYSRFEDTKMEHMELRGANLKGAMFTNVDLEHASLYKANLEDTRFRGAYLAGVNLNHANLRRADLDGQKLPNAMLMEADLENAQLYETWLCGANLENANLKGARVNRTDFAGASLKGVKGLKDTQWLETAIFDKTKVTLKERAIIKKALSKRKYLFIEDYE